MNRHFYKITRQQFLNIFIAIVVVLALVKKVWPSVAADRSDDAQMALVADSLAKDSAVVETPVAKAENGAGKKADAPAKADYASKEDASSAQAAAPLTKDARERLAASLFFDAEGREVRHRINSVPGFQVTFPDNQDVHLLAAQRHGVSPVENREEAERRKKDLVYVGANPYFHVDRLRNSVPYLVPRAAGLLGDIGHAFYDSLQVKGIPLHQIIVTSVLRTREDIRRLRGHNANATENSCHLYGTTFDLCYNRYRTVSDPNGPQRRAVRDDSLKWVLSEVLRDFRDRERCYIKYEVKQGCFHITVR